MSTWSNSRCAACLPRRRSHPTKRINENARALYALIAGTSAVSLLAGCPSFLQGRTVPYRIDDLAAVPAPELPPLCEGDLPPGRIWVIFSGRHCASCRELHRELTTAAERIRALGIAVVEYSIDEASCFSLPAGRIPSDSSYRGVAGDDAVREWGVRSVPMLFFVTDGVVRAVLHGAAPVEPILAKQGQIDGVVRDWRN
jgi:hypothetical protein